MRLTFSAALSRTNLLTSLHCPAVKNNRIGSAHAFGLDMDFGAEAAF
jgi:hypothetical protein